MSHSAVCSATRAVAGLAEARARALADPRALAGADPGAMRGYLMGGASVREPMAMLEERMQVRRAGVGGGGGAGGYEVA